MRAPRVGVLGAAEIPGLASPYALPVVNCQGLPIHRWLPLNEGGSVEMEPHPSTPIRLHALSTPVTS